MKSKSNTLERKGCKFLNYICKSFKNYHPPKLLALLFLLIPLWIGVIRASVLDNDFWFLVNTGKYITRNGFPVIEPFTIHQDLAFIVQQWLTDVIFYYIHLALGGLGIVIFTIMQFILIMYICYKLCVLISDNRVHLSIILTFFVSFLLSLVFVRSRPQMFDFIILLLTIYLLELYIRKKEDKYLYFLPILSLLLINLHASSFFMIFLFMLPYVINSFKFKFLCFESEGYPRKKLFIVMVIMFLVGLINPYGIKAITYIFTSYGNYYVHDLVGEMNYPKINTVIGMTFYTSIFLVLLCYIVSKNRKIKIRYFLLFLGTTFLGLSSIKGFSFFVIGAIFSLADYLKDDFLVYKEEFHYSKDFKVKYCLIVIIVIIIYGLSIMKDSGKFYKTDIHEIIYYLENVLKVDKEKIKLYTGYSEGSFAEYKGFKVYLDPRAEVFLKENNKKKDIIEEYYKLQTGEGNVEKFLKLYNFDYLIVNSKDYIYRHYFKTKENKDYEKLYTEKSEFQKYYLYKRK